MVTVLFYCTSKPGREGEMRALLAEMQRVSREQDRAVNYTFMQEAEAPREFALFEQWRDTEHLGAHVVTMKKHFGDPPPGARLPARLAALTEKHSHRFYTLVE